MEVHSWRRKTIESGIETAVFGGGASSVIGPFCFASSIQSIPRLLLVAFCQHIRVSGESRLVAVVAADSKTHPVELAVCSASMGVLGRPLSAHADGLNRKAEMRCRCNAIIIIQNPSPPYSTPPLLPLALICCACDRKHANAVETLREAVSVLDGAIAGASAKEGGVADRYDHPNFPSSLFLLR